MTLGYTDGKTKIKIGFFSLGILSLVALTGFELRKVIRGPQVDLSCTTTHCEHIVTDSSLYPLTGTTSNISEIHIGNRKIYTDTDGKFNEYITLYPGSNNLTISAKDRFGKEVKKDISVYYTSTETDTKL
ncbi:MAG: hypothetical protein V4686_02650 [Patescibacteria group bacterium]